MAKFVAYYNLCPIQDTEFLGLSNDKEDGNIITTHGKNIIMIIKLITQKQVRSWTVLDKLSSKVVYDLKSQKYVGVFSNHFIRCWDENAKDINKIKKIKFRKNIADLVCTDDSEPIILYSDGKCESLSSGIQSRKEESTESLIIEQQPTFSNSSIVSLPNGQKLLTYFAKNQKEDTIQLVAITLDRETLNPVGGSVKCSLNRHEQNVALSGYTVVEGQYHPSLFTIWSDRRVFMMPLTENFSPTDAPGNFVCMIDILKVDNPLSVVGISKNCVAIYGANSKQEGSSIILYNTQFKVVKAKQFFKIYFTFSRLWVVGNHILLAMGQNLSVVTFRVSKEILSEMIGSQISNDLENYVGKDFINEEDEIRENWSIQNVEENVVASTENIGKKLLELELLSTENIDSDLEINLMVNRDDVGSISDELQILTKELEKCGASEQEITEKVLPLLMKSDRIDEIATCLRKCINISDMMIAKLLKYVLTNENKSNLNNKIDESSNECKLKCFIKRENLLNLIISCSVNCDVALHIRREINYKQALQLIEYLYNLITRTDTCIVERPENVEYFDEDTKIIEWFNIILNTHFQELALSHDPFLINILEKWMALISLYSKNLIELDGLAASLYSLIEGKLVSKEKTYSKWYSIEEVKLY